MEQCLYPKVSKKITFIKYTSTIIKEENDSGADYNTADRNRQYSPYTADRNRQQDNPISATKQTIQTIKLSKITVSIQKVLF